jgi:hypothetical protein
MAIVSQVFGASQSAFVTQGSSLPLAGPTHRFSVAASGLGSQTFSGVDPEEQSFSEFPQS